MKEKVEGLSVATAKVTQLPIHARITNVAISLAILLLLSNKILDNRASCSLNYMVPAHQKYILLLPHYKMQL